MRLISGSQLFVVKWDIEGDETRTSLSKVTIEANDTPIQRPDPVNIQESSATAVKSHALLEENGIDVTVYDLIKNGDDEVINNGKWKKRSLGGTFRKNRHDLCDEKSERVKKNRK